MSATHPATAQDAKARFLAEAQRAGIGILYAGPWADCPDATEQAWAQAAQQRAIALYGPVDAALVQRLTLRRQEGRP